MPPKKAAKAAASSVYIVVDSSAIDSVHASSAAANERASDLKEDGKSAVKVEVQELQGGTIEVVEAPKKAAPKSKAKTSKVESEDEAPKANTAVKKTKPVAEQRAENAKKPAKPTDSDLPDNVKTLLAGSGDVFVGLSIVVTGVPPTLGRKNAETLVTAYGGKLLKSLSKKTDFVVVGNDAGPKKMDQISDLGIENIYEDEFIARIKAGGAGAKRSADEDNEEEESEEEKPVKAKKQKR